ncbi:glycosyltransferase family 4 protein [Puniceicoccaceae bacterium K14]|nr:glycosyltransferase family 4 protein [Puniceicoccaceae bacterium K14]
MSSNRALTVLMITSVLPRFEGDATPPFVLNQARSLVSLGHRVVVLAPHGEGAAFTEKVDGVEVRRFAYFFPLRMQKLCYEGGMLINLRKRPWTKFLLPFLFAFELLASVRQAFILRPDVIHSHSLLPQGIVSALVSKFLSIPHITTSHGNDVFGLKQTGLMGFLKSWTLRNVDAVTVNSEATREAVMALADVKSKLRLIHASPNEKEAIGDVVRTIKSDIIGSKKPLVLFVGRLIEEKGVADFLEAFALLKNRYPDAAACIVGDGQDRGKFVDLAKNLRIFGSVHWTGWLKSEEVTSWMSAADVLIVPSRESPGGWKEAQGLVIVEAMLVGLPVVASRVGGIPDMIENGKTGWLVEHSSPTSIFESVTDVMENQDKVRGVMLSANERAEAKFSNRSVSNELVRLYEEVAR